MRSVPPPGVDDAKTYDSIGAAKQNPRKRVLRAIRPKVISAYEEYVNNAPSVESLPSVALASDEQEALVHAYVTETVPMKELRSELMAPVVVARCPFCGIGESSTLDHYLPKEEHAQFSVLSKNLIPACSPCNTRKSTKVIDEKTNVRMFLHPYYDAVPNIKFVVLDVKLHKTALALRFRVVKPGKMTEKTFRHLKSHFCQLRLGVRFRNMSFNHLRDRKLAFARFYGSGKNAKLVSDELMQDATDFEVEHGPNHWRAVLYRTLARHPDFCDGGFSILDQIQ